MATSLSISFSLSLFDGSLRSLSLSDTIKSLVRIGPFLRTSMTSSRVKVLVVSLKASICLFSDTVGCSFCSRALKLAS